MKFKNIPDILFSAAGKYPGKTALVYNARKFNYRQLAGLVVEMAGYLQEKGVKKGDRVVIALGNSPEYIIACFGAMALGAVAVPIDRRSSRADIKRIIKHCGARYFITPGSFRLSQLGAKPVSVRFKGDAGLDMEAMVLYTSGSAARPKGVVHTHRSLLANACDVIRYLRLTKNDTTLLFLPACFSYALSQILTIFASGGRLVLMDSFFHPAYVLKNIRDFKVTGYGGVPAHHRLMMDYFAGKRIRINSLRYIMSAGDAIAGEELLELSRMFPGTEIINCYGCAEIGPRATYMPFKHIKARPGSIGKPLRSVKLRIVSQRGSGARPGETGEIALSGPSLMKGYLNDPRATRKALRGGYFYTGDLGAFDKDGFIYYRGRRDRVFKSGGEKINPALVEEALLSCRDVLEAAVMPVFHSKLGLAPKAFVVLRRGRAADTESLKGYISESLPGSHIPKDIKTVKRLNKTLNEKAAR